MMKALSISMPESIAIYVTISNTPTISAFPKFLPDEIIYGEITRGDHVLMIQETLFSCGGIAIGIVASHKIFDATALCAFMKTWATIARDSIEGALAPDFSASSIFPQNHSFPEDLTTSALASVLYKNNMYVTKRFVFDGSILSNLNAKAASSIVPNPTHVEVAFAFIVKCMLSALKKIALMMSKSEGEGIELCDFVHQLREAVKAINDDVVKSFEGDEGSENLCGAMKEILELSLKSVSEGMALVLINCWCNLMDRT
ncbi:BAHD acyltransferase BIA1-like [Tripterygium wilfordii]|uniref:BAHD acyltransferase BIA1-like n=1 Tax=Tripterygium wilfordii TaxID=458696 RepID=UPI0018F8302C|nr:BAHD acyltransferase BIA1-like [Tripterygium wilfordii]